MMVAMIRRIPPYQDAETVTHTHTSDKDSQKVLLELAAVDILAADHKSHTQATPPGPSVMHIQAVVVDKGVVGHKNQSDARDTKEHDIRGPSRAASLVNGTNEQGEVELLRNALQKARHREERTRIEVHNTHARTHI